MFKRSAPDWCSFFSKDQYSKFVKTLEKVLREQGVRYQLDLPNGTWTQQGSESTYGLVNMAQVCFQAPDEDWTKIILPFVALAQNDGEGVGLEGDQTDFESMRPLLRVRLFAQEALDPSILVTQAVSPTFHTCLALDLPKSVQTVKPEVAEAWGIPIDELFEIGYRNVLATAKPEREEFPSPDGAATPTMFVGDDFFVATFALKLDEVMGPAGPYGRFVAVPNRHVAMAAPIDTEGSLAALSFIVPNTRRMFHEGPGSISPYAYWVSQDGKWTTLDIDLTPRGVAVRGPDEFIDGVMQALSQ